MNRLGGQHEPRSILTVIGTDLACRDYDRLAVVEPDAGDQALVTPDFNRAGVRNGGSKPEGVVIIVEGFFKTAIDPVEAIQGKQAVALHFRLNHS